MKNLFTYTLLFLYPFLIFSQDEEVTDGKDLFLDGVVKLTENGLVLETADCLWPGTWSLGGVENENTGDKKADKLAKKQNKKVAKTLKKWEKRVTKADGKIDGMQVRGVFGSREGFFSPTKMWKPMTEPKPWDATYNVAAYTALTNLTNLTATLDLVSTFKDLGCALLADIYRGWIWDMYQRTQDLKDKSRMLDFKGENALASIESGLELYSYDIPNKKCNLIGMDEVMAMDSVLRVNMKQANKTIVEGIAGIAVGLKLSQLAIEKANENPVANALILKSVIEAGVMQTRILGDLKRLKEKIKLSEEVLDAINNL